MRQNKKIKMHFLQSIKLKIATAKLYFLKHYFSSTGLFWKYFDKVFNVNRKNIIVTKKCLGKNISIENMPVVGMRLGHVFPLSEYNKVIINGKYKSPFYKFKSSDQVIIPVRPYGDDPFTNFFIAAVLVVVSVVFPPASTYLLAIAGQFAALGLQQLLFPTPDVQGSEFDPSNQQPEITGASNTVSRGIIPIVFGRTKITPFYGQNPYRLIADGASGNKYRQFLIPTTNNITVEQEKLGETLVSDYSTNYLTITRSFGGSAFIGFDNVKAVPKEEQLTFDTDEAVNQRSEFIYNQATTSTEVTYAFILEFTDVVIGSWGQKTFRVTIDCDDNGTDVVLNRDFTIASGDLTQVTGTTYRATMTHTFTADITELESVTFEPVGTTRTNNEERDSGLEVQIISQTLTTDDYNVVTPLGNGVNNYVGVLTESITTSPVNTIEADLIFSFPQGIFTQQDDGTKAKRSVNVQVEYKTGSGAYQPIDSATLYVRDINGVKQPLSTSSTVVNGSTVTFQPPESVKQIDELFYRTIGLELSAGQHTFRIRSADLEEKSDRDIGVVTMSEFNFYVQGTVMDSSLLPNLSQFALDATAYKALTGELQQFNFIAQAQIPNWDGTNWDKTEVTRNPAAVIRYLLTDSRVNPRPEPISSIDNDSLVELHTFCETNNFRADGLINDPTKFLYVISAILSNCQAALTFVDGKYTFVIDDDTKPIVNQITPHNSFNFTYNPTLGQTTDAVRVEYLSSEDFTRDEFTLYYYNNSVHDTPMAGTSDIDYQIIKQDAQFTNDLTHIRAFSERNLRIIQEKRRLYEFDVSLESLTLDLFDRILVANSVDMESQSSGLIKGVITSGGNLTGFRLYSRVDITAGDKITIRSINMSTSEMNINTYDILNSGNTNVVEIAPIPYTGVIKGQGTIQGFTAGSEWMYDGDLFEIGRDKITECVVINIRFKENFTATVTAREA